VAKTHSFAVTGPWWEHVGLTGDYVWTEVNPAVPIRPLRVVRTMFQPLAA